jgi:hypothetical protein
VRHLQHPERNKAPRYQRRGDPCNNATRHPLSEISGLAPSKVLQRTAAVHHVHNCTV